jgi:serine protease AprX
MKRMIAVAASVMLAAACQDGQAPLTPETGTPASLLGIRPTVRMDPVLRNLLNMASPAQQLEVLVTFDPAVTTADAVAGALTRSGAGIIRFEHLPIVYAVATPVQITGISAHPGVISLYANKQLQYKMSESLRSIRADVAHVEGYTGRGVGVAILDSGIDGLFSPDLKYPSRTVKNVKMVAGWRDLALFGEGQAPLASDLYLDNVPNSETSVGHGTHVAGTAAGDGTASGGKYTGVAPEANLIGVGAGDVLFVLFTLAGFDYILDNQAAYNIQVVNNSWGGSGVFDPADPVNVATKRVYDRGIAVVFAAGNEGPGQNTLNPYSAAPWVISVAAGCKTVSPDPTNSAAQCVDGRASLLADFSSRGIPGDALYHPDVMAPGVNIVSTRAALGVVINGTAAPDDLTTCQIPDGLEVFYTCIDGTSMAAPHVAGTIALLEQAAGGNLSPDQAYEAIRATARPMPGYAQWEVGAGYLDAYAAVQAVKP